MVDNKDSRRKDVIFLLILCLILAGGCFYLSIENGNLQESNQELIDLVVYGAEVGEYCAGVLNITYDELNKYYLLDFANKMFEGNESG